MVNSKENDVVTEILTSIEASLAKFEARDLATFKRLERGLAEGNFNFYNSGRLREIKGRLDSAYRGLSNQELVSESYRNMVTYLDNLIAVEDPVESIRELVEEYEAESKR